MKGYGALSALSLKAPTTQVVVDAVKVLEAIAEAEHSDRSSTLHLQGTEK